MISYSIHVRCLDNEFHKITLTEDGALHFHNHKDIAELQDYLKLQTLGGKKCGCAVFWQNWQAGKWTDLPGKFRDICWQTIGYDKKSWRVLRRLQQARRHRTPQQKISDEALAREKRLPEIRNRFDFANEFIKAMINILVLRGHSPQTDDTDRHIIAVDEQLIDVRCLFRSTTSIVGKVCIKADGYFKHEVNVVPHKNAIRALYDATDRVELELVQMKYLNRPTSNRKVYDNTGEIEKLKEMFPDTQAHMSTELYGIKIMLEYRQLTTVAAEMALRILSTVEGKIRRVVEAAARHARQMEPTDRPQ